jgi:hypothetical protein
MFAGNTHGTSTDELIIRLIGGDNQAHLCVAKYRKQLSKIASWRGTLNGDVLKAILVFEEKFEKLPHTLDALDEFGLDAIGAPHYGTTTSSLVRDFISESDVQFSYPNSSLDVLIDAAYEEFRAEDFCEDLKHAKIIALGNSIKSKNGKREWKGVDDAKEFLSKRQSASLSDYEPEEGEVELVSGRDGLATFAVTAIPASSIKPVAISWLWPDRIPFGKMTLLSGKPDCGKSTVCLDIVTRVTRGTDWPDGRKNTLGPRNVLMAVAEDDLSDTVVPRLNAAGADLTRISFLNNIRVKDYSEEESTDEVRSLQLDRDAEKLRQAVAADPNIALVVVDTITSFFGDVNTNADQDVRPVMDALAKAFRDCGACFLAVIHNNKRNDVDAIQKILGASSVAGAVRAAWSFSRDPDNKEEFYMARIKNNLSKKLGGMKYKMEERAYEGIAAPYVEWIGETEETANEVMDKEKDTQGRKDNKQITLARAFLPMALERGPRLARELFKEAEAEGISQDQLRRAKYELDIQTIKKLDGWWWFKHNGTEQMMGSGEDAL